MTPAAQARSWSSPTRASMRSPRPCRACSAAEAQRSQGRAHSSTASPAPTTARLRARPVGVRGSRAGARNKAGAHDSPAQGRTRRSALQQENRQEQGRQRQENQDPKELTAQAPGYQQDQTGIAEHVTPRRAGGLRFPYGGLEYGEDGPPGE